MKKEYFYPKRYLVPALLIFSLFFLLPMLLSFYFSLTVWDLRSFRFVGWENFHTFFTERSLFQSVLNTFVYAIITSGSKVILSFFIAVFLTGKIKSKNLLRSIVFFPTLISTIAVGLTFRALMHPSKGLFNQFFSLFGIMPIDWLGNPKLALLSVAVVDIWKGVGIATVIYIAGIQAISQDYYEAAKIDGVSKWQQIKYITFPLARPAMNTVLILSFISGMRTFDLIWTMTQGGPGFASDVLGSVVYKQYAAGFFGLSTAGNVIMLILVALIAFPLQKYVNSREVDL